jgi:hypothetical protein
MEKEVDETANGTGLHLRADVGAVRGVQAVRFEISPADCDSGAALLDREVLLVERPMEDLLAAGADPELKGDALAGGPAHMFADFFAPVPAGCYDVSTTPVSATLACNRVHVQDVAVVHGETTDVLLVTQCTGGESVPPM